MLDEDLVRSLLTHSRHECHLNAIESYEAEDWLKLCELLAFNHSVVSVSLCLPPELHTDNIDILATRQVRIAALLSALQSHPGIRMLELSVGKIDLKTTQDIIQVIERNKNITTLSLPFNQLETWHLRLLFPAIQNNFHIDSINLSRNWLQSDSVKMIKDIMLNRKLYRLNLAYNKLLNSSLGLLLVPKSIYHPSRFIAYLDLSGNNINKFGIKTLLKKLTSSHTEVQLLSDKLILNDNPLGCMGGKTLARIFKKGFQVSELHLRNTGILDRTVVTLCNAMLKTKNAPGIPLRILNLEAIDIKFNASAAIANFIRKSTDLEKLTLSYDRINASNKLIIFESLRYNRSIKEFYFLYSGIASSHFAENRITYNLGESILDIFRENRYLEHIEFCNVWSIKNATAYFDIILENTQTLRDALETLENILQDHPNKAKNHLKYLSKLNICNTYINRIDSYYQYYCDTRQPGIITPSKEALSLLKPEYDLMKKKFKTLSMHISLYQTLLQQNDPSRKKLFDSNLNGIVNDLLGNQLHNVLFTNFMFEKAKVLNQPPTSCCDTALVQHYRLKN